MKNVVDAKQDGRMSRRGAMKLGLSALAAAQLPARAQDTAPDGPAVWLDMDQAALDDAYNQRIYAPNIDRVLAQHRYMNAQAQLDAPARIAYGDAPMASETAKRDPGRIGVSTKCTFCVDRIDDGVAKGLTPGEDPEATPACVNSCIAGALHFGDVEDAGSKVSRLLAENQFFRMHENLGTGPGVYYLWDEA